MYFVFSFISNLTGRANLPRPRRRHTGFDLREHGPPGGQTPSPYGRLPIPDNGVTNRARKES